MKLTVTCVVVSCCVLGLFCGQSEAIKCYSCASLNDIGCTDPFKVDSLTATHDDCALCSKTKGVVDGTRVILRKCESDTSGGKRVGCVSIDDGNNNNNEFCFCNSDLCNASTRASTTTTLLFLLPGLLLCLNKL